ncbi:MAG TPA: tetratricopeptide repeat protein [Silvibacterium sp.]|nr:tetratricopeptide repeat protein [Silvibacterium sp.]
MLASATMLLPHAPGQSSRQNSPAPHRSATSPEDPAQAELNKRILAAEAARNSRDLNGTVLANKLLIASALRAMGRLRLLESAYAQSGELYRESLDFEDSQEAHVEFARTSLLAGRPDDAIAEAQRALLAKPNDVGNYLILGRAYMQKGDFPKATEALSRAAQLQPQIETYYSLAICWLSLKTPDGNKRAQAVFEQMKAMAGDSGSLHVLFGRAYRDADLMTDAVREFQRAIELDPSTPHAHYFLGLAQLALNEWKPTPEAQAEFAAELRYHPKDFLANYMSGFLASSQRQYVVADKYMKIAAELNPTWPEPWLYMGLNAYAEGDPKAAEPLLRKAVDLTGTDEARASYQIRRAYVDLGRILASSGREQESEVYFAKARELQNKIMQDTQQKVTSMVLSEGAGSMAAMVPLDKRQESEAAPLVQGNADAFAPVDASVLAKANLSEAQRALAKTQEDDLRIILGQSYSDLATAEAMQRNYTIALSHYQAAEHWNPTIDNLSRNLGECAFRAGNYPEAIRGFSAALKEQPEQLPIRAKLGAAYFGAEKYADAAKTFAPLGVAGMQDGTVGYAWAASLARLGQMKEASDVLNQYEGVALPNDTLLLVGQLWTEIGDYNRAVIILHRALQADPTLRKAHFYAGLAYIRWEHWPEAENELHAELAIQPGDPDATYHLGFVALQESKTDEAAKLFEQVIAAHPEYANAQYELGKILLDHGQLQDAVPHLEAAARLSPDKEYVHYQLQAAYRKESRTADADRELAVYQELKTKSRPHLPQSSTQNP